MKTTGNFLRRSIRFYHCYANARLRGLKTFTFQGVRYRTDDERFASDLKKDIEDGQVEISVGLAKTT